MPLKPGKKHDEICYPFIYEQSWLCDFEIATDELCNHIGVILSLLPDTYPDISEDLDKLQPLVYHLNGSIRGKLAIGEDDIQWLLQRYRHYRSITAGSINGFVLPRGTVPAPQLHLARSAAKKAVRIMVRIDEEGRAVPDILHRFCNVMCNFFFVLAVYINQQTGFRETPFVSKSYGASR